MFHDSLDLDQHLATKHSAMPLSLDYPRAASDWVGMQGDGLQMSKLVAGVAQIIRSRWFVNLDQYILRILNSFTAIGAFGGL